MEWDLGLKGLLYLAAMSIGFGLVAQLLSGRAAPKWLWPLVSAVYFGVGLFVSEVWFGDTTEEELQPIIDGLAHRRGARGRPYSRSCRCGRRTGYGLGDTVTT